MKFKNTLLVVSDMQKSKNFYSRVLGLNVIADFGANVTLTGGLCLQTQETWQNFIAQNNPKISFGCNSCEIYFEEDNFDKFILKLAEYPNINYVHNVQEHSWGQRVVRFYDPDFHIIEVGENIKTVCNRFLTSGLSMQQTAKRMDVPLSYVQKLCK